MAGPLTHTYRTQDVPVRGGDLRIGVWEPAEAAGGAGPATVPTVLAIHGITATHRAWQLIAPLLPGIRVVAPDLRGRGRSNALPPPYGMASHADDAAAVLDHLGIERATVVGHSMGGFVAVVLHHRHPERVGGFLLVDGGLPLVVPEGWDVEMLVTAVLGPAAERLSQEFADREAYAAYWRAHPALGPDWNPAMRDYADYDLEGEPPAMRASTRPEAMMVDSTDQFGATGYLDAMRGLPDPTVVLRAPRGLQNEAPLYSPEWAAGWAARSPRLGSHRRGRQPLHDRAHRPRRGRRRRRDPRRRRVDSPHLTTQLRHAAQARWFRATAPAAGPRAPARHRCAVREGSPARPPSGRSFGRSAPVRRGGSMHFDA